MTDWVVITAPGSDIGQTITHHLLDQGYGIIGMGRSNSLEFMDQLNTERAVAIPCDYTDESSMHQAFATARSRVDTITALIHLVGGSLVSTPLVDLDLNTVQEVMAVNFDSAFLAAREAVRWMSPAGRGNIILFGSTTGIEPSPKKLAYGAAKAAVHHLVRSLALERGADGIMANGIAPGYVLTSRHDRELHEKATASNATRAELETKLGRKNVSGRIVQPAELLGTVDLLLTTTAIQGQIIRVDLGQVGF